MHTRQRKTRHRGTRCSGEHGFTLLEMLVAALIMGIAVAGLLSNLSTSLSNQARLTDSSRAAMLAKHQMDALLAAPDLGIGQARTGELPPGLLGEGPSGWRARTTVFDARPNSGIGAKVLMRIELQIFWMRSGRERTFNLDGYRRYKLRDGDPVNPQGQS